MYSLHIGEARDQRFLVKDDDDARVDLTGFDVELVVNAADDGSGAELLRLSTTDPAEAELDAGQDDETQETTGKGWGTFHFVGALTTGSTRGRYWMQVWLVDALSERYAVGDVDEFQLLRSLP